MYHLIVKAINIHCKYVTLGALKLSCLKLSHSAGPYGDTTVAEKSRRHKHFREGWLSLGCNAYSTFHLTFPHEHTVYIVLAWKWYKYLCSNCRKTQVRTLYPRCKIIQLKELSTQFSVYYFYQLFNFVMLSRFENWFKCFVQFSNSK